MREVVLDLSGEIDMANAWIVPARVAAVVERDEPVHIVVDLHGVTFIDCAGIEALIKAQLIAMGSASTLIASNPSPLTRQILSVLGVADQLLGAGRPTRHLRRRPSRRPQRRSNRRATH